MAMANDRDQSAIALGQNLCQAIWSGCLPSVIFLLEKGAEVNCTHRLPQNGDTPLHYAVRKSNLLIVLTLLRAGANPSAFNRKGETPLHEAIRGRHQRIVECLLLARADVNLPSKDGCTALHLAILSESAQLVDLILRCGGHVKPTCPSNGSVVQTSLFYALKTQRLDIVTLLVDAGARLDYTFSLGRTDKERVSALNISLWYIQLEISKFLIQNSTEVNPRCICPFFSTNRNCLPEYKKILDSVIWYCLDELVYTREFMKTILSLLMLTGYQLHMDPFCQWLIEARGLYLLNKNPELRSSGALPPQKDLLLDGIDNYFDEEFYTLHCLPLIHAMGLRHCQIRKDVSEKLKILKSLAQESFKIRSLESLCRIRVRKRLSLVHHHKALKLVVSQLPLPPVLIRYLMLEDDV